MAVPTPPTAGEPIAEAWGDVVHDAVVAMDIQSGRASVAVNNSTQGTAVVTFPRPFAAPPTVLAMIVENNSGPGLAGHVQTPSGTTAIATSLRVSGFASNITVTFPVDWIAYGPRA
jgi:hypothetical protein